MIFQIDDGTRNDKVNVKTEDMLLFETSGIWNTDWLNQNKNQGGRNWFRHEIHAQDERDEMEA